MGFPIIHEYWGRGLEIGVGYATYICGELYDGSKFSIVNTALYNTRGEALTDSSDMMTLLSTMDHLVLYCMMGDFWLEEDDCLNQY